MHYCVEKGNLEAVKFLIENGANFTIKDRREQTAVDICRELSVRDPTNKISNLVLAYCEPHNEYSNKSFLFPSFHSNNDFEFVQAITEHSLMQLQAEMKVK